MSYPIGLLIDATSVHSTGDSPYASISSAGSPAPPMAVSVAQAYPARSMSHLNVPLTTFADAFMEQYRALDPQINLLCMLVSL